MSLDEKLNPRRFPNMSPKMAAIVGYILSEKWTKPAIVNMTVTSDDIVMAMVEGDIGHNQIIGSLKEVVMNWQRLIKVAGLTRKETNEAISLFNEKVVCCA